jgi:4-amino-4-deoxy-L-arabinose transferase-like glycosyltransferase
VLKVTGVIAWSWWWVLSPLWISGILLVTVPCVFWLLLVWGMSRQWKVTAAGFASWVESLAGQGRDLGNEDQPPA